MHQSKRGVSVRIGEGLPDSTACKESGFQKHGEWQKIMAWREVKNAGKNPA
jgi:hypothetical protein